jgi:hypothetical protein
MKNILPGDSWVRAPSSLPAAECGGGRKEEEAQQAREADVHHSWSHHRNQEKHEPSEDIGTQPDDDPLHANEIATGEMDPRGGHAAEDDAGDWADHAGNKEQRIAGGWEEWADDIEEINERRHDAAGGWQHTNNRRGDGEGAVSVRVKL